MAAVGVCQLRAYDEQLEKERQEKAEKDRKHGTTASSSSTAGGSSSAAKPPAAKASIGPALPPHLQQQVKRSTDSLSPQSGLAHPSPLTLAAAAVPLSFLRCCRPVSKPPSGLPLAPSGHPSGHSDRHPPSSAPPRRLSSRHHQRHQTALSSARSRRSLRPSAHRHHQPSAHRRPQPSGPSVRRCHRGMGQCRRRTGQIRRPRHQSQEHPDPGCA